MVASLTSPADIVNAALSGMRYQGRIGWLYEGSVASKKALDIYAQARDFLLAGSDWGFPRGDTVLTLLKSAPTGGYIPGINPWNPAANPPLPYLFEYAYPADALRIRRVRAPLIFVPNFLPRYNAFQEANDNVPLAGQSTAPGRVILCNVGHAIGTYVRQVTDMTQWDVGFVDAFIAEIRRRIEAALVEPAQGMAQEEQFRAQVSVATQAEAMSQQGR
jgi:hypothetical protein